MLGETGNDLYNGNRGDDTLTETDASNDNDIMFGGNNTDNMRGGGGDDFVSGQEGNDTLVEGGEGIDDHRGGDGNDTINARDGLRDSLVSGGPGTDTCFFDPIDPRPRECEIQNPQ